MGFLRKTIIIGSGGLAPIKANSKKERIAKASEKQVRLQQQALRLQQHTAGQIASSSSAKTNPVADGRTQYKVKCPSCSAPLVSPASSNITCPKCHVAMRVTAEGESAVAAVCEMPGTATRSASLTDELERLATLHSQGALSADEFAAAKRRLLD